MPYTIDLNDKQINIIINKYQDYETLSNNDYTLFRAKIKNNNLTIYQTGKMLLQGKSIDVLYKEICDLLGIDCFINDDKLDKNDKDNNYKDEKYIPKYGVDLIGSDEVGTGDFFGGIIVCSCFVSSNDIIFVKQLGVKDSKQLSDDQIKLIAKELIKRLRFEVQLLSPSKYNEITQISDMNMNKIKAILHNSAICKLVAKTNCKDVVLDAFCSKENYYDYLSRQENVYRDIIFEEKAENKYLCVACASIIARFYFLEYIDKLSQQSGYNLLKGASSKVDELASDIIKEKGVNYLSKIAKMNFKNFKKAKAILNKKNKDNIFN